MYVYGELKCLGISDVLKEDEMRYHLYYGSHRDFYVYPQYWRSITPAEQKGLIRELSYVRCVDIEEEHVKKYEITASSIDDAIATLNFLIKHVRDDEKIYVRIIAPETQNKKDYGEGIYLPKIPEPTIEPIDIVFDPKEALIEDLTYITATMYEHYPGSQALMTAGMEIEQPPDSITNCDALFSNYEWHEDGSGPYETALPPKIMYVYEVKKFAERAKQCNFRWVNEATVFGSTITCGSHIHFRPREDIEMITRNWEAVWKIAFESIFTTSIFILPLLCLDKCRKRFDLWAEITTSGMPPIDPETVRYYLNLDCCDRPYWWLTWNKKREAKPLTLELRVAEATPAQHLLAISIIQKVVKASIQRGSSVYFSSINGLTSKSDIKEYLMNTMRNECNRDVYCSLEKFRDIVFEKQHAIPYLKTFYSNGLELFRDLLFTYTTRTKTYVRVASLASIKGSFKDNHPLYWDALLVDSFCWRSPQICDDEMMKAFEDYQKYLDFISRYSL